MAEETPTGWQPLDPEMSRRVSDARRQLHHAIQLASAFGVSYLKRKSDDSHTNLEWLASDGALASNSRNDARIAVRIRDLTLLIGSESFPLRGKTIEEARRWIVGQLAEKGFDPEKFTLARQYEIPSHPVGSDGARFDAGDGELAELARWFGDAAIALEKVRSDENGSAVRCWPHHLDIATRIEVAPGGTVGAGLEPGDSYYDEPYFYANMNPFPSQATLPPTLGGHGRWHTHEWIGAVLTASRLTSDAALQRRQITEFLGSAVPTCVRLLATQ